MAVVGDLVRSRGKWITLAPTHHRHGQVGVAVTNAASVATKIAEKKRWIRSTYTLHDKGVIPPGEQIVLNLHGFVDPELAAAVDVCVAGDH